MSLVTVHLGHESTEAGDTLLRSARLACEPVLRAAVSEMPAPLEAMAGYHLGWWDEQKRAVDRCTGKSVRAAIALGTAAACGGDIKEGVMAAAAVELLHNFTLLHDDVMDGDSTRRGRATVWRVWGINNAILLGDALHALAIRVLTGLRRDSTAVNAVARLETCCLDLCMGQFQDCLFEGRQGVTVEDYLQVASGKTARLIGCSCALGAISAGADEETVSAMDRFGHQLGMAFQIVDDLLGIWGDPAITGKPVGSDLARRKATLPVVAALNSPSREAAELAEIYKSDRTMTPDEISRAAVLVEACGGKEAAERCAFERFEGAIAELPDELDSTSLIGLARLLISRDR